MMYFGIPEIFRFFVYFMLVVNHVRGSYQHQENSDHFAKRLQYEFGRTTPRTLLGDIFDFERALQEFSDGDAFALSMSMSMSTSPEGRDASLSVPLVTDATSAPFRTERLIPCSGTVSTFVSMSLEVELVVGKTEFTGYLEQALTAALLDGAYTMCDPRRRVPEKTDLHRKTRNLEESILLSPLVVTATEQSCTTTDTSASSCRVAKVEMQAFGTDNSQSIVASVDSITKDDVFFDTILKTRGIVAVRVVQQSNRGSNIEASNASASSTLEPTIRSGQTVMAVVLSVAALTLVVAIIVRRGARRKRHLWYGPTVEETYDENQCLGIQPRESFENTSDVDTLYPPKAACF